MNFLEKILQTYIQSYPLKFKLPRASPVKLWTAALELFDNYFDQTATILLLLTCMLMILHSMTFSLMYFNWKQICSVL